MTKTSKNMTYRTECEQLQKMVARVGVGGRESAWQELQNRKRRVGKINKLSKRADVMLVRAWRQRTPSIPAIAARCRLTITATFVRIVRNFEAIKSTRDHAFTANAIRNAKRPQAHNSCKCWRRTSRPITNCSNRVGTPFDNRCQALNGAERNVLSERWKVEASNKPDIVNGGKAKDWADEGERDKIQIKALNVRNSVSTECALPCCSEKYSAEIAKTCSQKVEHERDEESGRQQSASGFKNPLRLKQTNGVPKKCHYLDYKLCKIVDQFQAENKLQALQPTQAPLRTKMQKHLLTHKPALLQKRSQISQHRRYHTALGNQLESSPKIQAHIKPQSLYRSPISHEAQLHASNQTAAPPPAPYFTQTELRTQTAMQTLLAAQRRTQSFVATQSLLAPQDRSQPQAMLPMQPERHLHGKICIQLFAQASHQASNDAIPELLHASNQPESRSYCPSRQPANLQNHSIPRRRHNVICAPEKQQTQTHSHPRTPAQICPQHHFQAQHTCHRPYPAKHFSALECLSPLPDGRDWLFRALPVRRCYHSSASPPLQPARAPTFSQLHLSHLWGRICPLLLLSTVLFLLTALPSVRAACRDEPARPCEAICSPDGRNCTLRALLLLPDDDTYIASMRRSMPVMQLAEQYLQDNSMLPPQLRWEWMNADVKCDAAYATIKAMDGIVKNCAHVVLGPVCDYALAAVSRIAKYFNNNGTPVITIGGATDSFELKKTSCTDEFYMLLRSGLLSFKSISMMIIELLKRYNWSNSILFYEQNGQNAVVGEHSCYLMMKSFGNEMRDLNLTFAQYSIMPELQNRTEELKREIGNKHTTKTIILNEKS